MALQRTEGLSVSGAIWGSLRFGLLTNAFKGKPKGQAQVFGTPCLDTEPFLCRGVSSFFRGTRERPARRAHEGLPRIFPKCTDRWLLLPFATLRCLYTCEFPGKTQYPESDACRLQACRSMHAMLFGLRSGLCCHSSVVLRNDNM